MSLKYFSGDTLSFIWDQTSYMSICVGEGPDDSSSAPQLRQKVKCFSNSIKDFDKSIVSLINTTV